MLTRRCVPARTPTGVRIDAQTDQIRSEDGLPSRVGIRASRRGSQSPDPSNPSGSAGVQEIGSTP
jgi:hypothetical protein